MAPSLLTEGYWQVNSKRKIFHIIDPIAVYGMNWLNTIRKL